MSTSNEALLLLIKALTKRVEDLEAKLATMPKKDTPETNIKISMTSVTPQPKAGACRRCGRDGHWATTCYARRDVYGNELDD